MQRFGHLFFWIAHIIYLIDFGVPKMVILVFLLGVIRGGVGSFWDIKNSLSHERRSEQTDERVAQYLRLDSCLFQTTVHRIVLIHIPDKPVFRKIHGVLNNLFLNDISSTGSTYLYTENGHDHNKPQQIAYTYFPPTHDRTIKDKKRTPLWARSKKNTE